MILFRLLKLKLINSFNPEIRGTRIRIENYQPIDNFILCDQTLDLAREVFAYAPIAVGAAILPFYGPGVALIWAGYVLTTGTCIDFASAGIKSINALYGNGFPEDAALQWKKAIVNLGVGCGFNNLAAKVAVRAINGKGALYIGKTVACRTGYIKNVKGFLTETVRDATKIGTGMGTSYIFSK